MKILQGYQSYPKALDHGAGFRLVVPVIPWVFKRKWCSGAGEFMRGLFAFYVGIGFVQLKTAKTHGFSVRLTWSWAATSFAKEFPASEWTDIAFKSA